MLGRRRSGFRVSPCTSGKRLGVSITHNVELFWLSLLNGALPDMPMMPEGWGAIPLLGLLALGVVAWLSVFV